MRGVKYLTQVKIYRRRRLDDPLDTPDGAPATEVTYSTEDRAPRRVMVPGENPSDEQVAAAIRQDLAAREADGGVTLEV